MKPDSLEAKSEKLRVEINRIAVRIVNELGGQAKCDELEAKLESLKLEYALT